jgi:hypothetical protein
LFCEFSGDGTHVYLKDSHSGSSDSHPFHVIIRGDDEIPSSISVGSQPDAFNPYQLIQQRSVIDRIHTSRAATFER